MSGHWLDKGVTEVVSYAQCVCRPPPGHKPLEGKADAYSGQAPPAEWVLNVCLLIVITTVIHWVALFTVYQTLF